MNFHHHDSADLSFVYYVDVPEDCANIRFLNQNINQTYMPMQKFMKKEPEIVNNFNTSNTSFGTKQPYFNSNAFQTQGSFRENNEGLVMPFTNFSGKYNNENFENTTKYNS